MYLKGEGSGTVPIYTMAHIAEQGIVAVTITYRIGNFGYMPVFESGCAVAALYHYLNPLSNNLFHKLMLCAGNVPNDIIDGKFFTEHPMNLLERGSFPCMPVLIGSNKDEFSMIELPMYYKALGITKNKEHLKEFLLKKYGEFADSLESELKPEANGIVDLQIQIMELLVFHSSALFLMEKIGEKSPVYGYRMNYIPNLYNGLRGSYHGAELAFFFGTIDNMNIHITDENKAAVIAIQKDWIQFIKFGKIEGRPLFNKTGKITERHCEKIIQLIKN
ncbi:hypothetical protein HMPREF9194_02264 [Treponema maltophilum ATCC 51939]|uniref:Carboxylesterase type B domain-containing protein n=1 Tax=Treponema maltophilum ATCC 51939 TaxID=1125699 RepID=S3L538_TREMA|nr:carboxylesterase family protein [Treponema maltophilum]EPF31909.1 hypothetical protein HMPREF9194_02264 [Treponema maltophilum ATCC 51939]